MEAPGRPGIWLCPPAAVPDKARRQHLPEGQYGEVGYQGLELGIVGLAVDGDPGAGVDAEVSGAGLFGFGAGQSGLDDRFTISHGCVH